MGADARATRAAVVALLGAPWRRDLIKKVVSRQLSAVISAASAGPYLTSFSRQLCQTVLVLRGADLTSLGRGRRLPPERCATKGAALREAIPPRAGEFFCLSRTVLFSLRTTSSAARCQSSIWSQAWAYRGRCTEIYGMLRDGQKVSIRPSLMLSHWPPSSMAIPPKP